MRFFWLSPTSNSLPSGRRTTPFGNASPEATVCVTRLASM